MIANELVEWVATGIEVNTCCACGCTGEECEGCTWLPSLDIKKLAKQILSHPDLYVKDELNSRVDVQLYISLADAIKEKINER